MHYFLVSLKSLQSSLSLSFSYIYIHTHTDIYMCVSLNQYKLFYLSLTYISLSHFTLTKEPIHHFHNYFSMGTPIIRALSNTILLNPMGALWNSFSLLFTITQYMRYSVVPKTMGYHCTIPFLVSLVLLTKSYRFFYYLVVFLSTLYSMNIAFCKLSTIWAIYV